MGFGRLVSMPDSSAMDPVCLALVLGTPAVSLRARTGLNNPVEPQGVKARVRTITMTAARERRFRLGLATACWALLLAPGLLRAAELKLSQETVRAWEDYVKTTESRMQARLTGKVPFLWMDESPERRSRVRQGEILAAPVVESGRMRVPQGLIHHWVGAVFIPDASLDQVFGVVHDYDHYRDYFEPTVIASKLLSRSDNQWKFGMRWLKKVLIVTALIDTEYDSVEVRLDRNRWYGLSWSTRIQEIRNYGRTDERRLPPDVGSGYIWRVYSVSRYEERDGGVYAELEALVLSRDVPAYFRWLVDPIVSRLSRNALLTSLEQTRRAVQTKAGT